MALDPAILTLIGTLCGGIGVKVTEQFFTKGSKRFDHASRIRDELRIEINSQKEEIAKLESERDRYRDAYYDLREEFMKLQTELSFALNDIKEQATKAENIASPPAPNPIEKK